MPLLFLFRYKRFLSLTVLSEIPNSGNLVWSSRLSLLINITSSLFNLFFVHDMNFLKGHIILNVFWQIY